MTATGAGRARGRDAAVHAGRTSGCGRCAACWRPFRHWLFRGKLGALDGRDPGGGRAGRCGRRDHRAGPFGRAPGEAGDRNHPFHRRRRAAIGAPGSALARRTGGSFRRRQPPGRRAQRTPAPRPGAPRSRPHLAGLAARQLVEFGAAGGSGDRDGRQADQRRRRGVAKQSRRTCWPRSRRCNWRSRKPRARPTVRAPWIRRPANCPIR